MSSHIDKLLVSLVTVHTMYMQFIQATVCLGAMHYHGMAGLEKNARKAFEVYNLAAERG